LYCAHLASGATIVHTILPPSVALLRMISSEKSAQQVTFAVKWQAIFKKAQPCAEDGSS
jgi:hypothetical protein